MDVITDLRSKTLEKLSLSSTIYPMMLPVDDVGIALRPTPTTDENWNLSNGRTQVYGVQVFIRSDSWSQGLNELYKIHDLWQGRTKPFLTDLTRLEATTNPNFVGVDDRNRYEFTAIYELHFERNDING